MALRLVYSAHAAMVTDCYHTRQQERGVLLRAIRERNVTLRYAMDRPHIRLKYAREALGKSAEAFAKSIGVNPHTYRYHENGKRKLTVALAQQYAPHLEVSAFWLLTGAERPPISDAEEAALNIARELPEEVRKGWLAAGEALLSASDRKKDTAGEDAA